MPVPTFEQWIIHLKQLSMPVLEAVPFEGPLEARRLYVDSFRDEFGSRRDTDSALLCKVLNVPYCLHERIKTNDLDFRLWVALHSGASDWESWIPDDGGLVPEVQAIEHRTLIELCSLHAIFHLVHQSMPPNPQHMVRLNRLVDWHTRELQPDNGINRPWGVVACITRSINATDQEIKLNAMLHAQTLISNCCISMGRPDQLSAFILLDAANALDLVNLWSRSRN